MNRISCLLFDLDGTLLDNRESIVDAVHATLQHYQPRTFFRENLLERFGESFDDFFTKLEPELQRKVSKEQVYKTYLDHLNAYQGETVMPFPFVRQGLNDLKERGFRLGVVTNKERELAIKGLEQSHMIQFFDTIVALDDVTMGKPAAEPIIKAMLLLQVRPEQTLMVGDSRYDVLAAQAAQVRSVILEWYGQGNWKELIPDYRFPDFQQFFEQMFMFQRFVG